MSRSWRLFLGDIVEASGRILRYTAGKDLAAFSADEMSYDAVTTKIPPLRDQVPTDPR